jgi:hypothetical protein
MRVEPSQASAGGPGADARPGPFTPRSLVALGVAGTLAAGALVVTVTVNALSDEPASAPPVVASPAVPSPSAAPALVFPDADSTGWRHTGVKLKKYNGSDQIDRDGTVIDGRDMGCVWVLAKDVVIKRSRIRCDDYFAVRVEGGASVRIEDTEIDGLGNEDGLCIAFDHFVAVRVDCHGTGDGVRMGTGSQLIDSYIHDLATCDECHTDAVQSTGGRNIVIRHNTIENPYEQTSCVLLGAEEQNLKNVVIEGNLFNGGGYSVYGGGREDVSGIKIVDNRFMRKPDGFFAQGGHFGPITAFYSGNGNEWRDNVWHDDGSSIPPLEE